MVSKASATAVSAMTLWVMRIMRRRLTTSAMAPPMSEKTMMGRMRARPTPPRAMGLSVISRMCQSSAQVCIWVPAIEIIIPSHSRRKRR